MRAFIIMLYVLYLIIGTHKPECDFNMLIIVW